MGCIAGALARGQYQAELARAGFTEVSVTFTHQITDGMPLGHHQGHRPLETATRLPEAATVQTATRSELPVVGQSGCC